MTIKVTSVTDLHPIVIASFTIEGSSYSRFETQVRPDGTVWLLAYTDDNSIYPLSREQAREIEAQIAAMRSR